MEKKRKVGDAKPLSEEEIIEEKSRYSRKFYTPIYEPKGDNPKITDIYNTEKRDSLLKEIEEDKDLPDEMRKFLQASAERHVSFDFSKIAEFYSHLPIKYKSHFENSALVIIDYDKAIRNGFISYEKEVDYSREEYLEKVISDEQLAFNKEEQADKRLRIAEEELNFIKEKTTSYKSIQDEEW